MDAPIIVNPEDGEFYKQPMYYALGHISRFIPPGSVRVGLDVGSNPVQAVAFKRPDNTYAVVLLNRWVRTVDIGGTVNFRFKHVRFKEVFRFKEEFHCSQNFST